MPTWKCKYFARREINDYSWNKSLENCGLCINWCEEACLYQELLKEQGDNDWNEEIETDDGFGFSRVNTEWDEWGGYGKPN